MKQIELFLQRYLHNAEHDQLHSNLAAEIEKETPEKLGVEKETVVYNAAREKEKAILQAGSGSAYTKFVGESDDFRDDVDLGFCLFVESHQHHPNPEIRENARKIMRIIDQYGLLRKLNYSEESSKLTNRNAVIADNYATELHSLANGWGTDWLNALDQVNSQFMTNFDKRVDEQVSQISGAVLEARANTDAAWEAIVTRINALAVINGEAPYAAFIDKANYHIDYSKALVKERRSRKENGKKEEDDTTK